jgi:hypothetical protein
MRDPLDGGMRVLLGLALVLMACEPAVSTRLTLAPAPLGAPPDTLAAGAVSLARRLAVAHGLRPDSGRAACTAGLYETTDSVVNGGRHGPTVGLSLCVAPQPDGALEFRIDEAITNRWGLKGDSLRRELRDSLVARFGRLAIRAQ